MPRRLLDRLHVESIRNFEHAAVERVADAAALRNTDRRLAALYLSGYAAEMILKAAYFRVVGVPAMAVISPQTRRLAMAQMQQLTPIQTWNQHHIAGWAELLVAVRANPPLNQPLTQQLESEVLTRGHRVYGLWREVLRYHTNTPYQHEAESVYGDASWFLAHRRELWR